MRKATLARFAVALLAVLALAGCGPVVSVVNNTKVPVRVIVKTADGSETFEPTPGESSSAEVTPGTVTVTAVPDADWVNYAKLTRQDLNQQLANSQNLSGPKLLDLVRRLKEIAAKMDEMSKAAGSSASCSSRVSEDSGLTATVSIGQSGALAVSCR
jgi:hypothetical protein